MKTSQDGIELIKKFEGFRSHAYLPTPNDRPTIGYGSTFHADGTPVELGEEVSEAYAELLLKATLTNRYEDAVNNVLVGVTLSQPQFDALVSFCYNIGIHNFQTSTLVKDLAINSIDAAAEFLRWDHQGGVVLPGLLKRREAERDMFLSGVTS